MASLLKDKLTGRDRSDSTDNAVRSKNYRLQMTAGPNYEKDLQRLLTPNSPSAHQVSEHASVSVRIKDYTGLPSSAPRSSEPYFTQSSHSKDTFSVAFAFTPPRDISAADLYFGLDTGHNPIRKFGIPKTLVNTAFKIVKEFIDPTLACDAGVDEPWVRGPAVAGATTTLCVGNLVGSDAAAAGQPAFPAPEVLAEGATSADAQAAREGQGIPADAGKRRKFFGSETNRQKVMLQKGRTYYFDFANGYIDWSTYALKLPGFSVGVLKWIGEGKPPGEIGAPGAGGSTNANAEGSPNSQQSQTSPQLDKEQHTSMGDGKSTSGHSSPSHKVRFFLKDLVTDEVFFVIMCTLLTGEDLRVALEEDAQRSSGAPPETAQSAPGAGQPAPGAGQPAPGAGQPPPGAGQPPPGAAQPAPTR